MKEVTKKYSNGEITIVWQNKLCIHSKRCWNAVQGLPSVFNPTEHPWIKPENASTEQIVNQINQCPSGALSFYYNNQEGLE